MGLINEKIVLEFYLNELERERISFLKGRRFFSNNVRNDIVWLIEADGMHEKVEASKSLWKNLFSAAMSYIDSDKRGYDVLFEYFDNYVEFEELIFASDSFYRDHTLHCMWVYFLGEYLYRNDEFKELFKDKDKKLRSFLKIKSDLENLNKPIDFSDILIHYDEIELYIQQEESVRCIAALCHDLGYPLKKISQINTSIKNILPYFYIGSVEEFKFTFSGLEPIYIESFIEFLSLSIGFVRDEEEFEELRDLIIFDCNNVEMCGINTEKLNLITGKELKKFKKYVGLELNAKKVLSKFWAYSRNFEEYNHGIMSAFLLAKNIKAFENMTFKTGTKSNYFEHINFAEVVSKQDILRAMTEHTNDSFKITKISSNIEFLSVMDELEEFSRISRANKSREYVEEYCKTEIDYTEGWFNINFVFDNKNIGYYSPEIAFKGRCKRFLTLFDVENLSPNLKIRVKFKIIVEEPAEYILEIKNKYAKIVKNGEEVDIPKYLETYQFYSSEGYMNL